MDFFEVVEKRHSYRGKFKDTPVSRDDLNKILQAGISAPSGCNAQTTTFIAVDDPQVLSKIKEVAGESTAIKTAQAVIAVLIDTTPKAVYNGMSFQVEDASAAVQNILLAITALGYSTVWIDGWLRCNDNGAKIANILKVSQEKTVRVLLPIGVAAETVSRAKKRPLAERVSYNEYKGA